ncbi:MarR family winged helix-turn-helix transcriptional regulator [Aestuariibius sp. 2305UL40-4]|uniref:MarR family winged helix-turn-helix transcriptional regulator n=1 Tax=Aestuariibius violaceus TaxID=3234132 RepID=UPI00345EA3B1
MTEEAKLRHEHTIEVRDRCLCFRTQRAARALARRFDEALRPFGLTNGQFSLLMAMNRPEPARLAPLADFLAMDRTTLTAALKPLDRRGLITLQVDPNDRRGRLVSLTEEGKALLFDALPIWRSEHNALDAELRETDLDTLKDGLAALSQT